MSQTILRILGIGLLLVAGFARPQPMPKTQFSVFWADCWSYAHHWNPGITVAEVDSFAKSTWEGVNHNPYQAHLYLSVCCEESGMHLLDNDAGFGYAGARWAVVIRALDWKGGGYWAYSERHVYEVNKAVARLFAGRNYSESTIHRWHNSGNLNNDKQYAYNVSVISKYNGR